MEPNQNFYDHTTPSPTLTNPLTLHELEMVYNVQKGLAPRTQDPGPRTANWSIRVQSLYRLGILFVYSKLKRKSWENKIQMVCNYTTQRPSWYLQSKPRQLLSFAFPTHTHHCKQYPSKYSPPSLPSMQVQHISSKLNC